MFSSFCFLSVLEGTKTSCRKRNLTYFLGQNCLPSIWYQKIPIFVCFFPPKIQQTSCTESTAGISRSLLHGQSQPPLEQGSAGRGQPEPKVQRTFCLFILPFQPGKDKLMSSAFSSLWLSFYTAERKRSYAQIFPPKQLSEYNKDKKQSDPPNSALLSLHRTRGTPTIAFSYYPGGSTSQDFQRHQWLVPRRPRPGFYFSTTNSIY